jgi:hypothetical protein
MRTSTMKLPTVWNQSEKRKKFTKMIHRLQALRSVRPSIRPTPLAIKPRWISSSPIASGAAKAGHHDDHHDHHHSDGNEPGGYFLADPNVSSQANFDHAVKASIWGPDFYRGICSSRKGGGCLLECSLYGGPANSLMERYSVKMLLAHVPRELGSIAVLLQEHH